MDTHCPTCGQPLAVKHYPIGTAEALRSALLQPGKDGAEREVYISRDRTSWHVTYGGGSVDPTLIESMVARGELRPVYLGSRDAYYLGRTIDLAKTVEKRQKTGDKKSIVFAV